MRLILLIVLLATGVAQATHLKGGYISVRRTSPTSLVCKVKLTIFVNTASHVKFGNGLLDFGDGTTMTPSNMNSTPRPDLGSGIGSVEFVTIHEFPGEGDYLEAISKIPHLVSG